jgi:hypothetical protein
MPTDDNDVYDDLDKSKLKFIYEQFLIKPVPEGGRLILIRGKCNAQIVTVYEL